MAPGGDEFGQRLRHLPAGRIRSFTPEQSTRVGPGRPA
jgi:hypothetical protein